MGFEAYLDRPIERGIRFFLFLVLIGMTRVVGTGQVSNGAHSFMESLQVNNAPRV